MGDLTDIKPQMTNLKFSFFAWRTNHKPAFRDVLSRGPLPGCCFWECTKGGSYLKNTCLPSVGRRNRFFGLPLFPIFVICIQCQCIPKCNNISWSIQRIYPYIPFIVHYWTRGDLAQVIITEEGQNYTLGLILWYIYKGVTCARPDIISLLFHSEKWMATVDGRIRFF